MFMEHENKYAYSIMQNQGYVVKINLEDSRMLTGKDSIQDLLSQDWSKKIPKNIFETFPTLGALCAEQKLCISDKIFDDFIDHLTDNLKVASEEELKSIFYSLLKWPETESIRTRNYIEVWAALDDECIRRSQQWSYDEMLTYVTLFYMLNVTRVSDFSYKCLMKLSGKAKNLTPAQLVTTMFFIGVQRKSPKYVHNLEVCITEHFDKFTIDELAIISMGFFKSKTPIRNMELVANLANKIIDHSSSIHEISLAALLKIIRYSMKITTDDTIYKLLDTLQYEVPRLSVMCNVHIALVGTSTLTLHEGCLNAIADMLSTSMSETRIKDLERLALTFGTFNFKPQSGDFISKMLHELRKPERESEFNLHGRSFACCIAYLGLLAVYPKDLIHKVLHPAFLEKTYGKHCIGYGREILTLHNTAKIFCKDSKISQLTDKELIIMAKKYTDYVPDENYVKQYNVTERMFLDVLNILREARGNDFVKGGHILTHHQRGDIILCNDRKGFAMPVGDKFDNKYFGLTRSPPDDNIWIALVIGGRNAFIRNTKIPSGQFKSKIRELNTLGFCAELISWDVLRKCETKEAKLEYLNNLIEVAIKNKRSYYYST
ncbi:unnamed protein product [Parnassius apollo]|uniref:(apollo) hypothetical protein n=1 Tax=Parnassius apollo TaxID=110799 RepID=A0A8S3WKD1_PARAO|nr:unnamed protein product [Parnassius apollo]